MKLQSHVQYNAKEAAGQRMQADRSPSDEHLSGSVFIVATCQQRELPYAARIFLAQYMPLGC